MFLVEHWPLWILILGREDGDSSMKDLKEDSLREFSNLSNISSIYYGLCFWPSFIPMPVGSSPSTWFWYWFYSPMYYWWNHLSPISGNMSKLEFTSSCCWFIVWLLYWFMMMKEGIWVEEVDLEWGMQLPSSCSLLLSGTVLFWFGNWSSMLSSAEQLKLLVPLEDLEWVTMLEGWELIRIMKETPPDM